MRHGDLARATRLAPLGGAAFEELFERRAEILVRCFDRLSLADDVGLRTQRDRRVPVALDDRCQVQTHDPPIRRPAGAVRTACGLYGTTMALPPALASFSTAEALNLVAWTSRALVGVPSPRILIPSNSWPLTRPRALSAASSTTAPASKRASRSSRLTMAYTFLNAPLKKPRLGTRRARGIWPPSNRGLSLNPWREAWPLWPLLEVLPCPEPVPRPTRFRFLRRWIP